MANTLDKIEISTNFNHLQIREITDSGGYHRRVLTPDEDVSGEVEDIKDKAEELWTDDVKSAWATFQEDEAKNIKVGDD